MQAYERILRQSLSMPHRPAVVVFEAFSWAHSIGEFYGAGTHGEHHLLSQVGLGLKKGGERG
jgi:hypothetical protein